MKKKEALKEVVEKIMKYELSTTDCISANEYTFFKYGDDRNKGELFISHFTRNMQYKEKFYKLKGNEYLLLTKLIELKLKQ